VGLGTELLLVLLLRSLILGPKQMHALLEHVPRAKTQFDKATRRFKSQLTDLKAPIATPKHELTPA
jgi:Sec-independent protein translocase protein TatA